MTEQKKSFRMITNKCSEKERLFFWDVGIQEVETMGNTAKTFLAIDCKSFYASVECLSRGLDPMTTNLVVADASRTEKTICLAVSPSLKAYGIPGRPRLFEVVRKVKEINAERLRRTPNRIFTGASADADELKNAPELALDYITAVPRMAYYIRCSTDIYNIYLKYVEPRHIHVYSIDEVFIDITDYLDFYKQTPRELAGTIVLDILKTTGITTTVGIGTNMYLCKVAMDIVAKHVEPDENGTRIAELDEMSYRRLLWDHRPLTDFWRVGRGYAKKLAENGIHTMGDIARCSISQSPGYNAELLYRLFGVNAELLIDHAWGWEPCTMEAVKAHKPQENSLGSGQVLQCPYDFERARFVAKEMADSLAFDLMEKGLVTSQIALTVGYDRQNLEDPAIKNRYHGKTKTDFYGRKVPQHAHGTAAIEKDTSSSKRIVETVSALFERIVDKDLLVRRINVEALHVIGEKTAHEKSSPRQLDLFTDIADDQEWEKEDSAALEKEKKAQLAMLKIKQRYGKNAVLRANSLEDGATAKSRNRQIGGHRA